MAQTIAAFLFLSLILSILVSQCAMGQDQITFRGVVKDTVSDEHLPFASLAIKNKPFSTVTNLNGEFTFHIPKRYFNDTLIISMLGYKQKKIPVNAIDARQPADYHLSAYEKILEGVVVTDSLTAGEIMDLALKRLPVNHPDHPVSMKAFYRESQKMNDKYVSLVESAITMYNENNFKPLTRPARTRVHVDQLRRSFNYTHEYNDFWDTENLLMHLIGLNPLPHNSKKLKKRNFRRETVTTMDGKTVYVLADTTVSIGTLRFYIQSGSYAIIRITNRYDSKNAAGITWHLYNSDSVKARPRIRNLTIDFREYNQRYHLNYISFDHRHSYLVNHTVRDVFGIRQELIVNEINTKNPVKIERKTNVKLDETLEDDRYHFDEEFWNSYNIIKETPLEKKLIEDLEKEVSLREQFKSQNKEKGK